MDVSKSIIRKMTFPKQKDTGLCLHKTLDINRLAFTDSLCLIFNSYPTHKSGLKLPMTIKTTLELEYAH